MDLNGFGVDAQTRFRFEKNSNTSVWVNVALFLWGWVIPAIVLGIFQKRMNKHGAIAGMLTGFLFTAGYIIFFKTLNPSLDNPEGWWLGISPEGVGTLGTIVNLIAAYTVSKFTPEPPIEVQEIVQNIRLPGETVSR